MIHYLNCTFVWRFIKWSLPNVFNEYFTHRSNNRYELRSNSDKNLSVPLKNTISYGIKSVTYQCILSWNSLPTYLKNDPLLLLLSKQSFLKSLFEHFIERYRNLREYVPKNFLWFFLLYSFLQQEIIFCCV